jgi:gliding motility-associated lipoprotein GldH
MVKEGAQTGKEKMRKNNLFLILPLAILFVLSGCTNNTLFNGTKKMDNEQWNMYNPAAFRCTVNDTVKAYDVTFSLRTSTDYPYRNIYLFVLTSFPSGYTQADTVQYAVTNEKGEWIGKGVGDIRELTFHYKSNVYFPEKGVYQFRIIHGMRDVDLKGVYDFGMKIHKRKQ